MKTQPIPPRSSNAAPNSLRQILIASLGDIYVGFDLSSVSSIIMPQPLLNRDGLPKGVAGVIRLRDRSIPVVAARERFTPLSSSQPTIALTRRLAGAPESRGDHRIVILEAAGAQAAVTVDSLASISADSVAAMLCRLPCPPAYGELLASGCVVELFPLRSREGSIARPVAIVDAAQFLSACCPNGGLDALRSVQTRPGALARLSASTGFWRRRNTRAA